MWREIGCIKLANVQEVLGVGHQNVVSVATVIVNTQRARRGTVVFSTGLAYIALTAANPRKHQIVLAAFNAVNIGPARNGRADGFVTHGQW